MQALPTPPRKFNNLGNIMKTSTTLKSLSLVALLGAVLTTSVWAQPGPGMGGGRGMRFNQNNTPGWTLMTPEERTAMQTKMRAVKTYEECKQLQTEHHTAMQARATEKGVTLNAPRQNGCDNMRARGWIK
jgi:hypothetical protein